MKLMIFDGNSIINRAFYGIRQPLTAPDGRPTNAVYGFLNILNKLIKDYNPSHLMVAFDKKGKTFRHEMFEEYKAGRKPMPDELAVQLPMLKEVLAAMRVPVIEREGFEADDILGTVSEICKSCEDACLLVSGDRDLFQLINPKGAVFFTGGKAGTGEYYDVERFEDEYGFEPKHMVDLKALMGDSSDNIPGVRGVGEKTASALIRDYKSIEKIYSELDSLDIKESVKKKLREGEDMARLSYELAEIDKDAPIDFKFEDAVFDGVYAPNLYNVLMDLGLKSFIRNWGIKEPDDTPPLFREFKARPAGLEQKNLLSVGEIEEFLKKEQNFTACFKDGLDEIYISDGEDKLLIKRNNFSESEYHKLLSALMKSEVKKISENIKDTMRLALEEGIEPEGFIFDTALAAYLLDSTIRDYESESLKNIYSLSSDDKLVQLLELYEIQSEKLRDTNMEKLYYEIELPLAGVLADMEKRGFLIDKEALIDFGEELGERISELERDIYALGGMEVNINSPKQLSELLYDKLSLPAMRKTKTGFSTDAETLEKIKHLHPVVSLILEYRELSKLKSTYTDGLLPLIAFDGRIHTNFKMTVTATGRLSSTEPNLQNIPIRKELGSALRKMFIAAEDCCLIDADYSQIELRILAHVSGDKTMIEAFKAGEDIHRMTAAVVLGKEPGEVTAEERSSAKAVNFGIVYGISAFSLAGDIKKSVKEANNYINSYLKKYSAVKEYLEESKKQARERGYAETIFGRRRPIPELKSRNFNQRSFGERVAMNMPIQGAAADIIKLAMVRADRRMRREGLKARLILQVHDELVVECVKSDAEKAARILKEEMEGAAQLSLPLTVDIKIGQNWAEAH